jgi:cell division protein FtsB
MMGTRKTRTPEATVATVERERRYIYSGERIPAVPAYAVRSNRKSMRRKVSTFYVILLLFGFGIAMIFYVNNIITVNRLASDIAQLDQKLNAVRNVNAALRAEVTKKAALERIGVIAREEMRMQFRPAEPTLLEVDLENLPETRKR